MKVGLRVFVLAGMAVSLLLALLISPLASGAPDGLEKVAEEKGFLANAADHSFSDGPLAGYSVRGVGSESFSTGLSGVMGVLLTFGVGYGLFMLVRSKSPG
ncbi:MAG: PDGLE domain-containing protein [Actinomycetota bacterium]